VNTGAFDPATEICARARQAGAWVHVDGAFGLWAAAAPARAPLIQGFADADSWATDCHKWLNVPYDSGLAFVRDPEHLRAAMAMSAAYLQGTDAREPAYYTPDASRRARGVEVWAALRSLGRERPGRSDRTELPARRAFRRGSASGGLCHPERGRAEPGAGFVRTCRPPPGGLSPRSRAMALAGAAAPSGTATPPCGSAYPAGRPRKRTSTEAWRRSCASPAPGCSSRLHGDAACKAARAQCAKIKAWKTTPL
jgi:hypothetical protein